MKPQAYQKPTIYNSDGTKAQIGTYDIRTDPLTNSKADGILDYINNNLEALNDKAGNYLPLSGGTLTGVVNGVTPPNGDNSKKLATTEFVNAKAENYLPLSGGTLTGVVNGVTPTAGDNSTKIATTEFVNAKAENYLPLSGGTLTGPIVAPSFQTGTDASHYFQCRKFRGEGNANTYYHAVDFGYSGHDQVDFYEYGGVWNFHKCTSGKAETSTLVGTITATAGWDGLVKGQDISSSVSTTSLTVSGATSVPTANAGDSSKAIANTAYVQGELTNYLPLSGGTLTGAINTANNTWNKLGDDALFGDHDVRGKMCIKSGYSTWGPGIAFFNGSDTNVGEVSVNNAFDFNKPVKENGGFLVPTGVVQAFAGTTIPSGWLLCDGSAVSRTNYAALYAVIGTTYGAGDGSTTFNLPNLVDKFVEGSATSGTVKSAGLPNITGGFCLETYFNQNGTGDGAFHLDLHDPPGNGITINDDRRNYAGLSFDASRSSSVYGNSTTVQPPALTMRYIIKY